MNDRTTPSHKPVDPIRHLRTLLAAVSLFTLAWANAQNVSMTPSGPGAPYGNLVGAFADINSGAVTGDIVIEINADVLMGGAPVLNSSGVGGANYNSILIRPTADNLTVRGSTANGFGFITLNGADNVTIDGDNPNTPGINRDLTILHFSSSGAQLTSAIRIATSSLVNTANNVTIRNCNVRGSATGRNDSGFASTTAAEGSTFGIVCGGGASTSNAANAPSALTISSTLATNATVNDLTITNCSIDQCARGIAFMGTATANSNNLTITNNVIGAAASGSTTTVYLQGISIAGYAAASVSGNTVRNIESFASASGTNTLQCVGIALGAWSATGTNAVVENNIITRVFNRNVGSYAATGLMLNLQNASNTVVRNNAISDITSDMTGGVQFSVGYSVHGIKVTSGSGCSIHHNSVNLTGALPGTATAAHLTSCLAVSGTGQTGLDVRNNIFRNVITGGTTSTAHVCLYLPPSGTSAMGLILNNNAYYTAATAGVHGVAHVGTTYSATAAGPATYAGLYPASGFNGLIFTPNSGAAANFRAYSSMLGDGDNDFASHASSTASPFAGINDLHITTGITPTNLESGGASLGISTDYDGQARPGPAGSVNGGALAPDIGADEFDGIPIDEQPPSITYTPLGQTCTPGARTLSVTITDVHSGVPTSGIGLPRLYWRINAAAWQTAIGAHVSGAQYDFTFGAGTNPYDLVSYYIVAQDNQATPYIACYPAASAAGFSSNPPAVSTPPTNPSYYVVGTSMAGTYDVGAGNPYPFNTLYGATYAYNAACLTGPVTFHLTDQDYADASFGGTEFLPITINHNPTASSVNTLTIRPTLDFTLVGGTTTGATLLLNGADHVTIDGSLSGMPNTVCPPTSSSKNLTFYNESTSLSSGVVWIASGSGSNQALNNTVRNCNVVGHDRFTTNVGLGAGGTYVGSAPLSPPNNTRFENNEVLSCVYGIYVGGIPSDRTQGTVITQNSIWYLGNTGIAAPCQDGVQITGNEVLDVLNTGSSDAVGINAGFGVNNGFLATNIGLAGGISNATITNNRVRMIRQTNTYSAVGIGLGFATSGTSLIANNHVTDVRANGTSGDFTGGVVLGGGTGGTVNLYHNTIELRDTIQGLTAATQTATCLAVTNTAMGTLNVKNNIFTNTQVGNTGATLRRASIALAASSFTGLASDHNDLYCAAGIPGTSVVGITGGVVAGTSHNTLADWQTATGQDANSKNAAPVFFSAYSPFLLATNPSNQANLNATGTPVGITADIGCEARSLTAPDMGVDEIVIDCQGVPNGTAVVGSACDDGDPCTTGDTWSPLCVCTGTLLPPGDSDGDGTENCADGCPFDANKIDPGQCGCGDVDTDTDNDGYADCIDPCPLIADAEPGFPCDDGDPETILDYYQFDCTCAGLYFCTEDSDCNDNDPCTEDLCDGTFCSFTPLPDNDLDGTCDEQDGCPADPNKIAPGQCGCGVVDTDTDGDLTADCNDGCPNDPLKVAAGICGCGVSDVDTDGDLTADCNDGCPNDPLKVAAGICGCGVSDVDTDSDGTADCNDGCPSDPLKIAAGQCGCGTPDTDTDSDGTADCNDGCPSDPLKIAAGICGCGVSDVDTDSDGTADCNDSCPNDPLKVAAGICGCGVSDVDTDGDLTADCIDGCPNDPLKVAAGICGCGVSDVDTDNDGTADCNDGCPLDPLKIAAGICGCGVSDVDTDSDGTADCNDGCPNDPLKVAAGICGCGVSDVDTDSDGTADCNDGCPNDPLKVAAGICGCGVSDVDTDSDGTADCIDPCPALANVLPGDPCDDGNALTINDAYTVACVCAGTPVSCVVNGDCNDNNDCTSDACQANTCVYTPLPDADGDGTCDAQDGCPNDPLKVAAGQCGCGTPDTDTDSDGTADCNDGCPNDPLKVAAGICGCGVSDVDTDSDGTADCNDGCPSDPLKIAAGQCGCGTPDTDTDSDGTADCNDGCPSDPLKIAAGQCGCGTPDTDTDSDGTADCNDGCPSDPLKIAAGICGCGVSDVDTDSDGTADCNDSCPNDPLKVAAGICGCGVSDVDTDGDLTADCNDGCPNDPLKVAAGICGCGVSDVDTDSDGTADCNDNCPLVPGQIGSSCDDGNAGTVNDALDANCVCIGMNQNCSFNTVWLDLATDDDGDQTSWDIVQIGTNIQVCTGSGYSDFQTISVDCCLPDGCYELRVFDSMGDGMTNGIMGGYVLRADGTGNQRIIDNSGDGVFTNVSQVTGNLGFCLPLGTDAVIASHCDKNDWTIDDIIQAQINPAVTAQFGITNATSGYQFWFLNPDGGYNRRITQTHAAPGSVPGAADQRAAFLRLSAIVSYPLPAFTNLNVRVRTQVSGVFSEWGPACRFALNPTCATTQLTTVASPVISCGATGLSFGNRIYATAVPGANLYQFEFTKPGYLRRIALADRSTLLNFVTYPLTNNTCYNVRVRVSFDGGNTYCPFGPYCTITIGSAICGEAQVLDPAPVTDNITDESRLMIWPNPNDGTEVNLSLDRLDPSIATVTVSLTDATGRTVSTFTVPTPDGRLLIKHELRNELMPGLYIVDVVAGDRIHTGRLVIQR